MPERLPMTPPSAARLKLFVMLAALLAASAARAGPPYVTDDPEPTELHRWEIYGFAAATRLDGRTEGATGLDLNYGGARDLQLTATLPLEFRRGGGATHWSGGDVELAMNLGVGWRLTDHWSFIGAAGSGLDNNRDGGRHSAYAALKADF